MINNICTLSDRNYISRAFAMIKSLEKYNQNIIVYFLCMDDFTYETVTNKNLKNIIPIHVNELIEGDERFNSLKPDKHALQVAADTGSTLNMNFYYAMSSTLPKYCFENYSLEHILYCDSDIFFYDSLSTIENDINNKSFGIVEHRDVWGGCGKYNVGIVYMKNNSITKDILELWNYCVLTEGNEYQEKYGNCGDQQYVELLYEKYNNDIAVIGDTTGHLAPWNLITHKFTLDEHIIWKENKQKVIYIHFSNFTPNFEDMTYKVGPRHGINSVDQVPWLARKCKEYLQAIKDNL